MCSAMNAVTRVESSRLRGEGGGNMGGSLSHVPKSVRYANLGRHQSTHAGERSEMMVGVAEQTVDHGDALEVVANLVLHGHANAAMELDRALADDAARAADLDLGGGDRLAPLGRVPFIDHHGRKQ